MIFSIALRYLPNIMKDYRTSSASIQARGLELDLKKTTLGAKLKGIISIVGPLVLNTFDTVSYTHLAVYKRQPFDGLPR